MKKDILLVMMSIMAMLGYPASTHADILKGRVVDAETREPLPEASIELMQQKDYNGHMATWIMRSTADSLGCFHLRLGGRGTLSASMLGYYSKQKVVLGFSEDTRDTIDVGDIALKPSETLMKLLEVKGRARRFTVRGDTIVFNPEAFHLEEGARLDELIRQLPGVEVADDGSMTWNGKPIRITMDGESLFGGDAIVRQLPAEAVENIKAYNKASKFSERTGKDDGGEDMVLDLTIKPRFLDRWYGDVEGTLQTPEHYNADFRMNRLSKTDPVMVSANANNMAIERHRTMRGGWGSWGNGYGQTQGAAAGYQHNWRQKEGRQEMRSSYSVSSGLTHADDWRTSNSETLNFMEDADTRRTYTEQYNRNHKLNPYVAADLSWDLDSLNTLYLNLNADHKQTRTNGHSDMRQDDVLRQLTRSNGEGRETSLSAEGNWHHFIDKDNSFGASFHLRYTDGQNESWTSREVEDLRSNPLALVPSGLPAGAALSYPQSISQHAHTPDRTFAADATAFYKRWLTRHWLMDASYNIKYQRRQSQQTFETNGTEDPANSYSDHSHSTGNNLKLSATIDLSPVKIMPALNTQWLHERQNYQRGSLDTTAARRRLLLQPQMRITWKMAKTVGMELRYNHSTQQPALISTLAYRDQTDPLYITEGNPGLKNTHTNNASLDFNAVLARQQLSLSATAAYTRHDRETRNALTYQPATGIYTSRPKNVPGGQTWDFRLNYDQGFGDIFRLQNTFRLTHGQSYAFLMQTIEDTSSPVSHVGEAVSSPRHLEREQGEGLPSLNRQTRLNPVENLTLSADWTWLKVSVFGELNANRVRYSNAQEQNTTQWNNRFGMNGELTHGRFVFTTRLTEQCYHGYTIASMNRNMLVWDAAVTWKIMKNKARLTLELDDILNQQDSKWSSQTAYQQTTSWHDFRHHYASLTFNYHLDAKK
ncbi:MAG: outer membrane beta-barrel protein [Bacteroidaceae bacterium]|nr:outer membrane beta-barrel protein [Bacteroidaceae bacterium]